ncbi:putative zinc-binding metallopeptidase [Variovorax saccharolyticus]|uniref:putative zinc-binding metallopeptidase n=1 Tax=Variovorax saccharolyticus TaxID=3053516 RepID=UPI002577C667|nr:putative zinc-binding metallopeptidase [Variovorax sp. J31P216]MDM0026332.1 putative zinc-binding metallopeptidase [Variovorax sp. J31P216]
MKQLTCSKCGNRVFFENLSCETCGSTLGYAPDEQLMFAFEPADDEAWRRQGPPGLDYKPCVNRKRGVCNWMLPSASSHRHCLSCRTTHTIPELAKPENHGYWAALEQAKRRLFYTLVELVLPTPNKLEDPANGSHPWEDWAETWAHYLHMVDGLETAAAWGAHLDQALPSGPSLKVRALDLNAESIRDAVIEQWLPVSQFINAMDRSLGAHDSYPFIVVEPVIEKLDFIHRVVRAGSSGSVAMNFLPRDRARGAESSLDSSAGHEEADRP